MISDCEVLNCTDLQENAIKYVDTYLQNKCKRNYDDYLNSCYLRQLFKHVNPVAIEYYYLHSRKDVKQTMELLLSLTMHSKLYKKKKDFNKIHVMYKTSNVENKKKDLRLLMSLLPNRNKNVIRHLFHLNGEDFLKTIKNILDHERNVYEIKTVQINKISTHPVTNNDEIKKTATDKTPDTVINYSSKNKSLSSERQNISTEMKTACAQTPKYVINDITNIQNSKVTINVNNKSVDSFCDDDDNKSDNLHNIKAIAPNHNFNNNDFAREFSNYCSVQENTQKRKNENISYSSKRFALNCTENIDLSTSTNENISNNNGDTQTEIKIIKLDQNKNSDQSSKLNEISDSKIIPVAKRETFNLKNNISNKINSILRSSNNNLAEKSTNENITSSENNDKLRQDVGSSLTDNNKSVYKLHTQSVINVIDGNKRIYRTTNIKLLNNVNRDTKNVSNALTQQDSMMENKIKSVIENNNSAVNNTGDKNENNSKENVTSLSTNEGSSCCNTVPVTKENLTLLKEPSSFNFITYSEQATCANNLFGKAQHVKEIKNLIDQHVEENKIDPTSENTEISDTNKYLQQSQKDVINRKEVYQNKFSDLLNSTLKSTKHNLSLFGDVANPNFDKVKSAMNDVELAHTPTERFVEQSSIDFNENKSNIISYEDSLLCDIVLKHSTDVEEFPEDWLEVESYEDFENGLIRRIRDNINYTTINSVASNINNLKVHSDSQELDNTANKNNFSGQRLNSAININPDVIKGNLQTLNKEDADYWLFCYNYASQLYHSMDQ